MRGKSGATMVYAEETDDGQGSSRLLARIAFVVILAGVGAVVAGVITSRATVRYTAEAVVELAADADPSSFLTDARAVSFSGNAGEELAIEAGDAELRFVGEAGDPARAARTANLSADAFVAAQNDPQILVATEAEVPTSPSSPRRMLAMLIGISSGALLGLLLQPALRPTRRDPDASYIDSWTSEATSTEIGSDRAAAIDFVESEDAEWGDAWDATPDSDAWSGDDSWDSWDDEPSWDEDAEPSELLERPSADDESGTASSGATTGAPDAAESEGADAEHDETASPDDSASDEAAHDGVETASEADAAEQVAPIEGQSEVAGDADLDDEEDADDGIGDGPGSETSGEVSSDAPAAPGATASRTGTTIVVPGLADEDDADSRADDPAQADAQDDDPGHAEVDDASPAASPDGESAASADEPSVVADSDTDDSEEAESEADDSEVADSQSDHEPSEATVAPDQPQTDAVAEISDDDLDGPETEEHLDDAEHTLEDRAAEADDGLGEGWSSDDDDAGAAPDDEAVSGSPAEAAAGFRSLVARTSANIDPLVDRFAEPDDRFVDDVRTVGKTDRPRPAAARSGAFQTTVHAPDDEVEPEHLVEQITYLTDELARYQQLLHVERTKMRTSEAELGEAHVIELDSLSDELATAKATIERLENQRDSARAVLEDRVGELETELAARTGELERLRSNERALEDRQHRYEQDLSSENDFLRTEITRYQQTIDEERVAHSTALTAARLENQDELDQIHREHRLTLNQLAHTNRNLLTTQRSESEAAMAAVEAEHQRQLDEAHADYERRLREAKAHFEERLASTDERAAERAGVDRDREIATLRTRLAAARTEAEQLQQRVDDAAAEALDIERRAAEARRELDRAARRSEEGSRALERRVRDLEQQLARSEERLAAERRRTGDVVRNLLEESASSVADAERARVAEIDGRAAIEAAHRKELDALVAEARAFERAAAEREALLEATIAALRAGAE